MTRDDGTRLDSMRNVGLLAVVAAISLILILEAIDGLLLSRLFADPAARVVKVAVAFLGVAIFTLTMLKILSTVQRRLQRQNEELGALHEAGLAINSDLDLDVLLQRVADESRRLTGARYGAVMAENLRGEKPLFFASGISPAERAKIGNLPEGRGVLGLAFRERRAIRIDDIGDHPASIGFPPHHPPMHSLLTVPIGTGDDVYGQLYLADRTDRSSFNDRDQQTVERFATLAAIAIKNARQMEQTEALAIATERNRVAAEMHDHIAQVLGFVSAKSQATSELIEAGDDHRACAYLDQIAEAAGEAFDDVREQIIGLRSPPPGERLDKAIHDYLDHWSQRTGIASSIDFEADAIGLSPETRLQILRIVQEALTNARKHADCTHVCVTVASVEEGLVIDIDDNGRGPGTDPGGVQDKPRFGLAIMAERASSIGGEVNLESSPSGGARVRLSLPSVHAGQRGMQK